MTGSAAWRWCVLAGAATMLASTGFGRIGGLAPCGPSGGLGSIMAFELARTPAEIAALFGAGQCRDTLAAAQTKGLLLDGLAFIPSYASFLVLAALAARGAAPSATRLARLAIGATLLAALFDEIEGGLLYAILRDLPGSPMVIGLLYWEARSKFALLALAALIISGLLAWNRRLGLLFAIPVTGGALFSLRYIATDMHAPPLMQGYRWSWIALLAAAIIGSFWPRAFSSGSAGPPRRRAPPSA